MTAALSIRAAATLIGRTNKQLGVNPPKPYAAALTATKQLTDASEELITAGIRAAALAVAALNDCRDPLTDPDVQHALACRQLDTAGLRAVTAQHVETATVAAVTQHADTIVDGWNKALQPDYDMLHNAAETLEVADLARSDMTALRKAGTLALWADATAALDRVTIGEQGARSILTLLGMLPNREQQALIYATAAPSQLAAALTLAADGRPTAWLLARVGGQLSLAGPSELIARTAGLTAAHQQQQQHVEAEAVDA